MTSQEAYIKFLTKLNKNLNTNNVTADPARFVIAFNENLVKRIIYVIGQGNDEDIREIQAFLKPNTLLTEKITLSDRVTFQLPPNYLDFSSGYAKATKGVCKGQKIFIFEIKDKNYTEILSDDFNKPSFEYREAPFIVADNKVQVFKEDFEINEAVITYYIIPTKIDIEGYIKENGSLSTNINPQGDDRFLDKVISMTVADFQRNYQDQNGYILNKERIETKN